MERPDDNCFFSVIMPVYNHMDYLAVAIESVINQTFKQWELIVIDDGSTDDSLSIAKAFAQRDDRIVVLTQENSGPAAARNLGIKHAKTQWLTFLDSDDIWLPDALAHYKQAISANPEASFFYGYRHRLDEGERIKELSGQYQDKPTGAAELFQRMFLSHLCVCWHRELAGQVGGYDESLRSCEDYELYLRMSLQTNFVPIQQATGLRRRHDTNISRRSGFSRFQEAEILRRFIEKKCPADTIPQRAINRRLGRLYYSAARLYFSGGSYKEALLALKQSGNYRRNLRTFCLRAFSRIMLPFTKPDSREMPWLNERPN